MNSFLCREYVLFRNVFQWFIIYSKKMYNILGTQLSPLSYLCSSIQIQTETSPSTTSVVLKENYYIWIMNCKWTYVILWKRKNMNISVRTRICCGKTNTHSCWNSHEIFRRLQPAVFILHMLKCETLILNSTYMK